GRSVSSVGGAQGSSRRQSAIASRRGGGALRMLFAALAMRVAIVLALAGLAALGACEVGAMSASDSPPPAPAPPSDDAPRLRVIAKLRLDSSDSAGTSTEEAAAKAARIAAARQRLLPRLAA